MRKYVVLNISTFCLNILFCLSFFTLVNSFNNQIICICIYNQKSGYNVGIMKMFKYINFDNQHR